MNEKIKQKLLKSLNHEGVYMQLSKLTKKELSIIDTYFREFESRDTYIYANLYNSKHIGLCVLYFLGNNNPNIVNNNNFLKKFNKIKNKLK